MNIEILTTNTGSTCCISCWNHCISYCSKNSATNSFLTKTDWRVCISNCCCINSLGNLWKHQNLEILNLTRFVWKICACTYNNVILRTICSMSGLGSNGSARTENFTSYFVFLSKQQNIKYSLAPKLWWKRWSMTKKM